MTNNQSAEIYQRLKASQKRLIRERLAEVLWPILAKLARAKAGDCQGRSLSVRLLPEKDSKGWIMPKMANPALKIDARQGQFPEFDAVFTELDIRRLRYDDWLDSGLVEIDRWAAIVAFNVCEKWSLDNQNTN